MSRQIADQQLVSERSKHSANSLPRTRSIANESEPVLSNIQNTLQHRYDVSVPFNVSQFVCHNASHLKQVSGENSNAPEMLFFRQDGDNLDVSLYIDSSLLTRVDADTLQTEWLGQLFNDCCLLLEGVSHFLYLTWNAQFDRQVSLLDMELQAEVDKFVFAAFDTGFCNSQYLLERLFQQVSYRDELTPALEQRYKIANELAYTYCNWLQNYFSTYLPDRKLANRKLAAELARFYRLNGKAKQRHITKLLH